MTQRPSVTIERRSAADGNHLLARWLEDRRAGLEVQRTLGQGGMGIVRLAREPTLRRDVAVKSLHGDGHSTQGLTKILQEAWILARLDHPNIVPIHGLEIEERPGADPVPRIVMKRIEGRPWDELLADEAALSLSHADPLEWKLRVLISVCNAVAYAHSRDILHLDLKPENVMVGTFGEVYLMDWGIAMSLEDDDDGRLPRTKDLASIIGTPSYLAPEMLECDGGKLSPATDVYLLGGILYELLTGDPPHRGSTMAEILHDVLFRTPKVEAEAPDELSRLAERALAIDPAERPTRAEDVRVAIEHYLEHRGSDKLCEAALASLAELEHEFDAPDDGSVDEDTVYDHFGAARFGFVAALERWPENQAAREGLARASERMIDWEISRDRPQAAVTLLAGVVDPPLALRERVEVARAAHEAALARAASVARERDPRIGQRTRFFLGAIFTTAWWMIPLARGIQGVDPRLESYDQLLWIGWVFIVCAIGFAIWARESMRKTEINRGTMATLISFLATQIGFGLAAKYSDMDMLQLQPLLMLLYANATASMAIFVDRRFALPALGFAIGAWGVAMWPLERNWILVGTNFVLAHVVLWIWRMPAGDFGRRRAELKAQRAAAKLPAEA